MNDNISFRLWDIDKYINFLKAKYTNIKQIKYLPQYQEWYNNYLLLSYDRFTRLLKKGYPTNSKGLRLSPSEIRHFKVLEKEIEKLKNSVYDVVILDWFIGQDITKKKHFIFDKEDLQNFDIDITNIHYCLTDFIDNNIEDFKTELDSDFLNSPLPKKEFYVNRISQIKELLKFEFLDFLLSNQVINGLDNSSRCFAVAMEFIYIKQIQHIENKIFEIENPDIEPIQQPNNKLTQKQIVLLFQCLSELGIFQKNKISQDNTKQIKLIALIVGIAIPDKPNNWDFYKYWNSVQSVTDDKQIITKNNLNALLNIVKEIDYKELENNILQKINELN